MKVRLGIVFVVCTSLSACATVNMTELEAVTSTQSSAVQPNVVLKASERLSERFSEKGWVEKTAFKFKQAALTLLRGNNETLPRSAQQVYAAKITPDALKSDIVEATYLAQQTSKAADVYLEYLTVEADLTPDLQKLEKALLDCRQAENTFEYAASIHQAEIKTELSALNMASTKLQKAADVLGTHVRQKNQNISAQPIN